MVLAAVAIATVGVETARKSLEGFPVRSGILKRYHNRDFIDPEFTLE